MLWDVDAHKPLGVPAADIYTFAFSPHDLTMAVADDGNKVELWDLSTKSWADKLCGMIHRNLTLEEWREYVGSAPYEQTCASSPPAKELLTPGSSVEYKSVHCQDGRQEGRMSWRDANGKLFRFQSDQFRHTVGTRIINLGVPDHFIQRYLGRRGREMTNRFAQIHGFMTPLGGRNSPSTEYLRGTLVDVISKVVPEEGPLESRRSTLVHGNGARSSPAKRLLRHSGRCRAMSPFEWVSELPSTSAPTPASSKYIRRSGATPKRVTTKACANGWPRQTEMNVRK